MKNVLFIKILLILYLFLHGSCRNYGEKELVGTYVNNYSENINPMLIPPEAPAKIDTLILLENNKFTSQCFGKGTYEVYELNNSLYIGLNSHDTNNAGYNMIISSIGLLKKTIILYMNIDGNYYYKKIK